MYRPFTAIAAACIALAGATLPTAQADSIHATPGAVLAEYTRDAGAGADPTRGRELLGRLEAGATPLELETDGPVDHVKLDKWFATRCQATLGRACQAREKADVAAWLVKEQFIGAARQQAPRTE
mgnify:FL=1|jgi:hypothetical protein